MRGKAIACALSCALVLGAAAADAKEKRKKVRPPTYTLTEIPPPPGDAATCVDGYHVLTFARRLNDSAHAVGYGTCYVATGDPAAPFLPRGFRAFGWTAEGGTVALPSLNPEPSDQLARDINESGVIAGREAGDLHVHGVVWTAAGGLSELFAGTCTLQQISFAEDVNDHGVVLGRAFRAGADGCRLRALLHRPATGEEVAGPPGTWLSLNNHEVVVGLIAGAAVKWSPTGGVVVLSPFDPRGFKFAWELIDDGRAVGHLLDGATSCPLEAYAWSPDGVETRLPNLRGLGVAAFGINDAGYVVGHEQALAPVICDSPDTSHALLWIEGEAFDLNALVKRRGNVLLTFASAINSSGQILARGVRTDEAPVPCPIMDFDPETGEPFYDDSRFCQNEYAFLLTPKKKKKDSDDDDDEDDDD